MTFGLALLVCLLACVAVVALFLLPLVVAAFLELLPYMIAVALFIWLVY